MAVPRCKTHLSHLFFWGGKCLKNFGKILSRLDNVTMGEIEKLERVVSVYSDGGFARKCEGVFFFYEASAASDKLALIISN